MSLSVSLVLFLALQLVLSASVICLNWKYFADVRAMRTTVTPDDLRRPKVETAIALGLNIALGATAILWIPYWHVASTGSLVLP
jgi:hypothetical protein